jgi:hypothetical protein
MSPVLHTLTSLYGALKTRYAMLTKALSITIVFYLVFYQLPVNSTLSSRLLPSFLSSFFFGLALLATFTFISFHLAHEFFSKRYTATVILLCFLLLNLFSDYAPVWLRMVRYLSSLSTIIFFGRRGFRVHHEEQYIGFIASLGLLAALLISTNILSEINILLKPSWHAAVRTYLQGRIYLLYVFSALFVALDIIRTIKKDSIRLPNLVFTSLFMLILSSFVAWNADFISGMAAHPLVRSSGLLSLAFQLNTYLYLVHLLYFYNIRKSAVFNTAILMSFSLSLSNSNALNYNYLLLIFLILSVPQPVVGQKVSSGDAAES